MHVLGTKGTVGDKLCPPAYGEVGVQESTTSSGPPQESATSSGGAGSESVDHTGG